ncbi:MAG: hypothetical protein M9947_00860 [Thermomicrobiales bacterium]|nr:hypothetical protein [Thermomicrobiales bacterium]
MAHAVAGIGGGDGIAPSPIAVIKASTVRAAMVRRWVLSRLKTSSIGLKSGE